jgi:hypothetical protein
VKLYYSGSEIPAWKNLLASQGITTMSMSYVGLSRRSKKVTELDIKSYYPENTEIFLDSGAFSFNRENSDLTLTEAQETAGNYMNFVQDNIDAVNLVSEFDAQILGYEAIKNYREVFFDGLDPVKFMPIWHAQYGLPELEKLCSQYEVVGITQPDMRDTSLIPVLNNISRRYQVRLHGVAITGKKMLRSVKWDSVSSASWRSPSAFGDTILWDNGIHDLRRFPKHSKAKRRSYRHIIESAGFDYQKIEDDDSTELLKLSVWSWDQFIRTLTTDDSYQFSEKPETTSSAVDILLPDNPNGQLIRREPEKRETVLIPVLGAKFRENADTNDLEQILFKRSESMRICNTCFLRDKCVMYKTDANCAYSIPIEIKTKQDLTDLQNTLVEMQVHRVLFMQMAEDVDGGYADPNLSAEMDRLQRMIKAKSDADKQVFSMTIQASQPNAGPGFMEQLLGSENAGKLRALDAPVKADELIKNSEIYEAEIVDGK